MSATHDGASPNLVTPVTGFGNSKHGPKDDTECGDPVTFNASLRVNRVIYVRRVDGGAVNVNRNDIMSSATRSSDQFEGKGETDLT
jgi:hypothetical protein